MRRAYAECHFISKEKVLILINVIGVAALCPPIFHLVCFADEVFFVILININVPLIIWQIADLDTAGYF